MDGDFSLRQFQLANLRQFVRVIEIGDGSSLLIGQYDVGVMFVAYVSFYRPYAQRVGAVDGQ